MIVHQREDSVRANMESQSSLVDLGFNFRVLCCWLSPEYFRNGINLGHSNHTGNTSSSGHLNILESFGKEVVLRGGVEFTSRNEENDAMRLLGNIGVALSQWGQWVSKFGFRHLSFVIDQARKHLLEFEVLIVAFFESPSIPETKPSWSLRIQVNQSVRPKLSGGSKFTSTRGSNFCVQITSKKRVAGINKRGFGGACQAEQ
mmetsp:Transcript_3439/g.4718  ORF Transcript_3439/g.4718 Transcript_3439/m.4718 type:complete len:202 (-) Transcript_3439:390-995(-)